MRCAGLHRSVGVHISRVRSISLDSWTKAQADFMLKRGNRIAKEYFEASLPPTRELPKDNK
ncbi:hypothetical protein MXB_1027 [Myxobolus squamalis]|nr:hypothetical protein MXB_1027 [Myxobolus squamalis]